MIFNVIVIIIFFVILFEIIKKNLNFNYYIFNMFMVYVVYV